jgi:transmembrane sensor
MNSKSQTNAKRATEDEAIQWHVLLRSGIATESDWMDFTRWLEEDLERNEAYDLVSLSWEAAFEQEPVTLKPAVFDFFINFFSDSLRKLTGLVSAKPWAFGGGFGVAAAAMAVLLLAPALLDSSKTAAPQIYATAVGEQRSVTLQDGSTVLLNTATTILVNITPQARRIELKKGEAFFTVQHENDRIFEVMANGLRITDLGTSFDVRAIDARTQVSVIDGIVEVEFQTPTNQGNNPVRLVAGQQAVHSADTNIKVQSFDASQTTAWQRGNFVFKNDKLPTVVAEINRYFEKPLLLEGRDVSNLSFSGIIQMSDQKRTVRDLVALLSLQANETDTEIVLTRNTMKPNQ